MSKINNNQSNCVACGFNPLNFANTLYGEVPDNHPDDPPSIKKL